MSEKQTPAYDVKVVTKREGKDDWWDTVGSAWLAKNGSLVVELRSLPLTGRLILTPWKEKPPRE